MRYEDFEVLRFETRPNGVLLITLDRAEHMNATNARLQCATVVNVRHRNFGNTAFDVTCNDVSQVECSSIGLHQEINIFKRN